MRCFSTKETRTLSELMRVAVLPSPGQQTPRIYSCTVIRLLRYIFHEDSCEHLPHACALAGPSKTTRFVCFKVKSGTYDFEANKALLKLYQFFPDLCKPETVALLLTKVCVCASPRRYDAWPARIVASRQHMECEYVGAWREGSIDGWQGAAGAISEGRWRSFAHKLAVGVIIKTVIKIVIKIIKIVSK